MTGQLRILIFLLAAFFLSSVSVFAGALTPLETGIFELQHIALEISAAEESVRFVIVTNSVDRSEWGGFSLQMLRDLMNINGQLTRLDIPEALDLFKLNLIELVNQLRTLCIAAGRKPDKENKESIILFQGRVENYNKRFRAYTDAYWGVIKLSKGFDPDEIEKRGLRGDDKMVFKQSLLLIQSKRYKEANDKLEKLLAKYKGSALEGNIISRMMECRQASDNILLEEVSPDESLSLMNRFIERGAYSSKLYRIFEQWRTLEQSFNYGESNWSFIPNKKYIERRWLIVQNIEKYLDKNPDDIWAKRQIVILMSLSLIRRGGMLGNTNMFYELQEN